MGHGKITRAKYVESWECLGAFTALLIVSGSQPFLLNTWVYFTGLRGMRKELCPNGFISQEGKVGGTRLREILGRMERLGQSSVGLEDT